MNRCQRYSKIESDGAVMTKRGICVGNIYGGDFILEEWKDVPNYEGLYQISNLGRVKGQYKKLLKPAPTSSGYLAVTLCNKHGDRKTTPIHRLVCEQFVENPENKPTVNHKDEIKINNYYANLEWCTVDYNNKYSNNKAISQLSIKGNFIKDWCSAKEAERQTGIYCSNIGDVCKGKRQTAGGFKWLYK